jgi:hypothetical protein
MALTSHYCSLAMYFLYFSSELPRITDHIYQLLQQAVAHQRTGAFDRLGREDLPENDQVRIRAVTSPSGKICQG